MRVGVFSVRPEADSVTVTAILQNKVETTQFQRMDSWPLSLSLEVDHEAEVTYPRSSLPGNVVWNGDAGARMCLAHPNLSSDLHTAGGSHSLLCHFALASL